MREETMVTADATIAATEICSMTDVDLAAMTEGTAIVMVAARVVRTRPIRLATTTI
jgi:hypothetical protein